MKTYEYDDHATHRCKVCGALWRHVQEGEVPGMKESWSLRSTACGKCCDAVAMGDQIEPLPSQAEPQQAEPVAWFEKSKTTDEWFIAYTFNPDAETKPLYLRPAPAPGPLLRA